MFANSEDPDDMQLNIVFHQGLHCSLKLKKNIYLGVFRKVHLWSRSGSVVECLTRDRGAADSSLTGVTALCP